jgi:hypothetical protein
VLQIYLKAIWNSASLPIYYLIIGSSNLRISQICDSGKNQAILATKLGTLQQKIIQIPYVHFQYRNHKNYFMLSINRGYNSNDSDHVILQIFHLPIYLNQFDDCMDKSRCLNL